LGHLRPIHSGPVPINVRCYSNSDIPPQQWEETYAWPADNESPYSPLGQRILWSVLIYVPVILAAAIALQVFTRFPVLNWWAKLMQG
jgi:hypothetical protein